MKIKWWHIPAALWGIIIIVGGVLAVGFFLNAHTGVLAIRCADIAEGYEGHSEYEKAAQWYGRAAKLRRGYWWYEYYEAEAWRKAGRWEEALEAYDDALALEPKYIFSEDVYLGKAQALAGLGRWEEAVDAYRAAIEPELSQPFELLYAEATRLFELETYEVTIGKPFDLHPTVWDEGKYVEVLAYLEAASELDPSHGYPYYLGGRAWLALEQYEKAASRFGEAAEIAPDFVPARERKAWTLALMGRHEAALACVDTALILDTGDLEAWRFAAWNTKGKILLLSGEAAGARECFDHALARAPYPAETLIGKGLTYFAEGDYEEARAYFEDLAGAYGPSYYRVYLYMVEVAERRPSEERPGPLRFAPPEQWPEKVRYVLTGRISAEDALAELERQGNPTGYTPARYEIAPPASPGTAPVKAGLPGIAGGAATESLRSSAVISRIVNRRKEGIGYIYKKHLVADPDLEGRLVVKFTVAASGAVTTCSVVSSTLGNAAMEREVCSHVVTWRFPPIEAGEVSVVYPFVFFSAGPEGE